MTSAIGMAKGMNDVERLAIDRGGASLLLPDRNGEFVRYTDYAALQQQLAAAREALALFVEFYDAGEPPGDVCFEKARATLQRDRQP